MPLLVSWQGKNACLCPCACLHHCVYSHYSYPCNQPFEKNHLISKRMHSSRMCTTHSFTVSGGACPGGVPAQGGACPGGCLPRGGCLPMGGGCLPGRVPAWGVPAWGVPAQGGVPCDLSHHAFDVTCMLPPHQLRLNTQCSCLYTVGPLHAGIPAPL